MQIITCLAPIGTADNMVSGTVSGQLFLWTDRNCVRNVKAHQVLPSRSTHCIVYANRTYLRTTQSLSSVSVFLLCTPQGTVNVVYSCEHGVLSGGKDKRVRLWTHRLEPGATFDMANFGVNPIIRSACLSPDGTSMLIGTRGADIFEVKCHASKCRLPELL